MKLVELLESLTLWFHGTPELQKLESFENKHDYANVISDLEKYDQLTTSIDNVEWNSDEYHELLDELVNIKDQVKVRVPVFFTNNLDVASSYANDDRAFDYQNATSGIIKAHIKDSNNLIINGNGNSFSKLPLKSVIDGMMNAGLSRETIDYKLRTIAYAYISKGYLSTSMVSKISYLSGFDIVDIKNVKDSYNGGSSISDIRMVFDNSLISVIS